MLPPSAWKELLDGWETLSVAVQVRVLRLCARNAERFSNGRLLSLLSEWRQQQQEEAHGAGSSEAVEAYERLEEERRREENEEQSMIS